MYVRYSNEAIITISTLIAFALWLMFRDTTHPPLADVKPVPQEDGHKVKTFPQEVKRGKTGTVG